MPGVSIVAAIEEQSGRHVAEKLRRRALRDASDPLSYPNAVFISYYRLNKEAFIIILDKISQHLSCSSIPPAIELSTTLRFLATGAYQEVIAKDVNISVGRSTVSKVMWRVLHAMENIICPQWIKLQMASNEKNDSKAHFFQKYQIPGVIGCIDGTHIKLNKPSQDESLFLNRKGTFSINVMIICDYRMNILAVNACMPGSCHDAFIWQMSSARNYFFNQYIEGDTNSCLLGDSGYGLEPFLLTPYKDVAPESLQHKFNQKHASGRNIVERTIGVLKSRFRCLLGTSVYIPQKVVTITNVCCALHNICRHLNIEWEEGAIPNENFSNDLSIDAVEEFSQRNMLNAAKRVTAQPKLARQAQRFLDISFDVEVFYLNKSVNVVVLVVMLTYFDF